MKGLLDMSQAERIALYRRLPACSHVKQSYPTLQEFLAACQTFEREFAESS